MSKDHVPVFPDRESMRRRKSILFKSQVHTISPTGNGLFNVFNSRDSDGGKLHIVIAEGGKLSTYPYPSIVLNFQFIIMHEEEKYRQGVRRTTGNEITVTHCYIFRADHH